MFHVSPRQRPSANDLILSSEVSTGSGSDRVTFLTALFIGKGATRSLPLPVLTSRPTARHTTESRRGDT